MHTLNVHKTYSGPQHLKFLGEIITFEVSKLGPTIPLQDAHQATWNAEQECKLKMHIKTSSAPQHLKIMGEIMAVEVSKLGPTIPPQDAHQATWNAEQECTLKCTLKHHQDLGPQHLRVHSKTLGWTHGGRLIPIISFSKILAHNATWNVDVWVKRMMHFVRSFKGKTYRRAYRKRTNCQSEALVRTDSHCTSENGRNFEIQQAGSRLYLHLRLIYVQADRCL